MKDLLCNQFQETVGEYLIRHRSVLDVMAKLQEASARTNRAITKAVTSCGCIRIDASKQQVPPDISLQQIKEHMHDHLNGELCEHCREVLEAELGNMLFYLAGMANLFGLNLYDVMLKEHKKLAALGVFNFSD
jgi:predicted house-cleaning noncanonical NTP pyrophosphatase (MazG superfamily)